jgi:hypothetical protein
MLDKYLRPHKTQVFEKKHGWLLGEPFLLRIHAQSRRGFCLNSKCSPQVVEIHGNMLSHLGIANEYLLR